jgi:hypothetical protein
LRKRGLAGFKPEVAEAMEKRASFIILAMLALVPLAYAGEDHSYYIAGAYVSAESKAFIDILNPGDKAANIDAAIYYEKNDSGGFQLKVEPQRTVRVDLSQEAAGNFGLALKSDQPVVVDSVEYDAAYSGGFGGLAALKPDFVWYFGEGYSSGMVKTYLFILNPNPRESNIGVTLYYENGEKRTFNLNVPAYRQLTVDLKEKTMPEKRFGMKVTGTTPIVAATANFNKKFSAGSGGTGTNLLSKSWYFPDGYTSTEATEFINVVNPSFGVAHLKFTIYYDDGTTTTFDDTVPANSKDLFLINNYAAGMRWFSTVVESDVSVAAENTHYDSSYSAGHGSIGATSANTDAYFAYCIAREGNLNQLAVFNPSAKEASLDITFYYSDGSVKQLKESVPSLMRSTIDLNQRALPDKPFGMHVHSSEPVLAKQIIYDKKQSAGYAYIGMPMEAEEEKQPETEDKNAAPAEEMRQYALTGEEKISVSKLEGTISKGLAAAMKYDYSYGNSSLLAWHFSYTDDKKASDALRSALSGDLFSLMEVTPASISGLSAHYFAAQKSEGYMWLNGNNLYIFVGPVGESGVTMGLAELFVAGTPPQEERKTGLLTIIAALAALVLLVVVIRWLSRRRPGEGEEAAWSGIIPSARPKQRKARKEEKRPARHRKPSPRKERGARKGSHKEEKTESKPERRKPEHKEDGKEAKAQHTAHREEQHSKQAHQKVSEISIREVPRDKLTAQDLLDDMEEIPDYEDVFRHVNRDQEEIKPK